MKTDRELLELAARAAGMVGWRFTGICMVRMIDPTRPNNTGSIGKEWNPLTDDGDALRLAVKLGIIVDSSDYPSIDVQYKHSGKYWILTEDSGDADVSARRAIVRAAAAIGEGMK